MKAYFLGPDGMWEFDGEHKPQLMGRRDCIKRVTIGTAALLASLELEGCTPQGIAKLEAWINLGLTDFQGIVAIINPAAGSALEVAVTATNAAWTIVQAAIKTYQDAPAADKATALGKVSTVVSALMGQLSGLLGLIPGAATFTATVKAALLLIMSTLNAIAIELPTTTTTTAVRSAAVTSLALPPAPKNDKDFQNQFNQILVNGGYKPMP